MCQRIIDQTIRDGSIKAIALNKYDLICEAGVIGVESLTSLEKHDLVVLKETHEARHHLGKLYDLLDGHRQLLRDLHPQLTVRLRARREGGEGGVMREGRAKGRKDGGRRDGRMEGMEGGRLIMEGGWMEGWRDGRREGWRKGD